MKNVMRKLQEIVIVTLMLGASWVGLRAMEGGLRTIAEESEEQLLKEEGRGVGQAATHTTPKTSVPKIKHLDIGADVEPEQPEELSARMNVEQLTVLKGNFDHQLEALRDGADKLEENMMPTDEEIAELREELAQIKILDKKIGTADKTDLASAQQRAADIAEIESRINRELAQEPEVVVVTKKPEVTTESAIVQKPKPVKQSAKAYKVLGETRENVARTKAYKVLGTTQEEVARTAAEQKLAKAYKLLGLSPEEGALATAEQKLAQAQQLLEQEVQEAAPLVKYPNLSPSDLEAAQQRILAATRKVHAAQVEVKSAAIRAQKAAEVKLADIQSDIKQTGKTPKLLNEQRAAKQEVAAAQAKVTKATKQLKQAEKDVNKAQAKLASTRKAQAKVKK